MAKIYKINVISLLNSQINMSYRRSKSYQLTWTITTQSSVCIIPCEINLNKQGYFKIIPEKDLSNDFGQWMDDGN